MAAKGKIVNTTTRGKWSLQRTRYKVLWDSAKQGTFNRGRNRAKRDHRKTQERV
jgi:hypothetical protein